MAKTEQAAASLKKVAESSAPPTPHSPGISSSSSTTAPKTKVEAVAQLVGFLEESRQSDENSFQVQLQKLKREKEEKRKEQRRLASQAKKIHQKQKRLVAKCNKASTEELLEVLRHRAVLKEKRSGSDASSSGSKSAKKTK